MKTKPAISLYWKCQLISYTITSEYLSYQATLGIDYNKTEESYLIQLAPPAPHQIQRQPYLAPFQRPESLSSALP